MCTLASPWTSHSCWPLLFTSAVCSSIPISIVPLGALSRTFAAESGIQRKNLSKCGITRRLGRMLNPGVGGRFVNRKFGISPHIAMAPALHPASDAPVFQFLELLAKLGCRLCIG